MNEVMDSRHPIYALVSLSVHPPLSLLLLHWEAQILGTVGNRKGFMGMTTAMMP